MKKWVEHTDSPPEMMELRHSLAEKWVAYRVRQYIIHIISNII